MSFVYNIDQIGLFIVEYFSFSVDYTLYLISFQTVGRVLIFYIILI